MKELENVQKLFHSELQLLWSAENMLVEAIPLMIEEAKHQGLKNTFRLHLAETRQHKVALEMICKQIDIQLVDEPNPELHRILEERNNTPAENASDEEMDSDLIAGALKVERYEISRYSAAATFAEMLGFEGIAQRLRLTLAEEIQANTKLNFVLGNIANTEASEFRAQIVL